MNNKIYHLVVGIVFTLLGAYILIFDHQIKLMWGSTKAYIFSGGLVAYGLFRIWRAYKIHQSS